jgi:hypothetical protein
MPSEKHRGADAVGQDPSWGSAPRTASDGYQSDSDGVNGASEEVIGSDGYQTGSDQPSSSEQLPRSEPDDGQDRMDPYEAYARAAAKVATEEKRDKERSNPAIWLPGPDSFDQESGPTDRETGFSRDWRRGNPQVSVRLRPLDFESLRRAAELYGVRPTTLARMMVIRGVRAILDADLRRSGEELREPRA